MPEPHVIVFLKVPRKGMVKTRLAATIGKDAALTAYRKMTEATLNTLTAWPKVQLRFTPDEAGTEIHHWLQPHWQCAAQGYGDLGERMDRAFKEIDGPTIIIGTDCPLMRSDDLIEASQALREHDIVLGPAKDGGYWLIGLKTPCSILFEDIQWSTETVLAETLARAKAAKLSCHLLRELADVDTEEEWKKWSG